MAKKKRDNKVHLIIIGALLVVFFGILFLSTQNKNLEISYRFEDNISVDRENIGEIKVGEAVIKNNGFLTSRATLNKYIGCKFEGDNSYERSYLINYRGEDTVSGKIGLFSYDYHTKRLDVSSGEEAKLRMNIRAYSLVPQDREKNSTQERVSLYMYLVEEEIDNYYNFCDSASKEDAFKVININVDYKDINTNNPRIYKD